VAVRDCSLRYSAANRSRVPLRDVATHRSGPEVDRDSLIRHLRELIAALDARVPHLERTGETRIADDAKALRAKAVERIAAFDRER